VPDDLCYLQRRHTCLCQPACKRMGYVIQPEILQARILQRFPPTSTNILVAVSTESACSASGEFRTEKSAPAQKLDLASGEDGDSALSGSRFGFAHMNQIFTKSTLLQDRDSASRLDRIPVSRIRTVKARMWGTAALRTRASSLYPHAEQAEAEYAKLQ